MWKAKVDGMSKADKAKLLAKARKAKKDTKVKVGNGNSSFSVPRKLVINHLC